MEPIGSGQIRAPYYWSPMSAVKDELCVLCHALLKTLLFHRGTCTCWLRIIWERKRRKKSTKLHSILLYDSKFLIVNWFSSLFHCYRPFYIINQSFWNSIDHQKNLEYPSKYENKKFSENEFSIPKVHDPMNKLTLTCQFEFNSIFFLGGIENELKLDKIDSFQLVFLHILLFYKN